MILSIILIIFALIILIISINISYKNKKEVERINKEITKIKDQIRGKIDGD